MDFSMISDFLNSQTGSWALFLSAASAVCAWAATLMPAPSETSGVIYRSLYKVINWIGANIGKARNADAMQTFLRLLEAVASLWASFRAYAERRRAAAARDALSAAPVRVLCGKLGGQPDNPAVAHTDEPASGDAGRD